MKVDLKSEGAAMDITTKKGRRGRKDIDRIIVEKGRRGDFSPLQPDHYHSFYEIFYLWSGSCRFLLKDTVYQMEAGDLVFIAPGELHHSLYSAGEVCEIVMIYFKEEYLHLSDRSADSLTSISGQGLQLHSFMGSVPTVYQEYLHSLLTRMLTENSRFDQYSEHFERCYLEELLLMLMRHSVMNEKEPDLLNSRDADILLATRYIYNNFRKPLTLEEVSSVASLSPTYFSKKFKLITGMGFKEYLNYVRLKHAQTALLTTDSSITDFVHSIQDRVQRGVVADSGICSIKVIVDSSRQPDTRHVKLLCKDTSTGQRTVASDNH
jgi:AraC-like DNA-binding protein/mannose-6-phosphate isomerase-like protein (cupin superfamily)